MICMHDLSAQFDHPSNKYTMCTVQNDEVTIPLMGPFWGWIIRDQNGTRKSLSGQNKPLSPFALV